MKIHPALIDGEHPSKHPNIAAAAAKADAQAARHDEPYAVWIRPNSAGCVWTVPDNSDNRLAGCVMVYASADGWISIPDAENPNA